MESGAGRVALPDHADERQRGLVRVRQGRLQSGFGPAGGVHLDSGVRRESGQVGSQGSTGVQWNLLRSEFTL